MKHFRTISTLLSACILTASCITPQAIPAKALPSEAWIYGDVNDDNHVDVSDAVLLARYFAQDRTAKVSDLGLLNADVNVDEKLDDDDLNMLLEYIGRIRDELGIKESEIVQTYRATNLMNGISDQEAVKKEADEAFISSQMKLTVDLFRGAAQDSLTKDNMLVSPLSVSQALAMTANGAVGTTKEQMEKLLGDQIDLETLNAYYRSYTDKLTVNDDVLHIANSLWIRDDKSLIDVPKPFLQTTNDYYHAGAFKAPFDDTTVEDVNNWVNVHTHKMIPHLVDKIEDNWIMMLVNALAFEAEWDKPYYDWNVDEDTFHAYDGNMKVEMMHGTEYSYLEDENATGFLKYYKDANFAFAAILPNESISVNEYIDSMTGESLQKMLTNVQHTKVNTEMPKFKYEYSINMNEMLKALGMTDAFVPGTADFSKLNTVEEAMTYIGLVLHKTFIQVDERGTKAGAATMVAMAAGAALEPEPKYVTLDRPFIYAIIDRNTNLPVFIGTVLHPTKA